MTEYGDDDENENYCRKCLKWYVKTNGIMSWNWDCCVQDDWNVQEILHIPSFE